MALESHVFFQEGLTQYHRCFLSHNVAFEEHFSLQEHGTTVLKNTASASPIHHRFESDNFCNCLVAKLEHEPVFHLGVERLLISVETRTCQDDPVRLVVEHVHELLLLQFDYTLL